MDRVQKGLTDIERKLGNCNKIAEQGDKISLSDAIKLSRKSNSIVSTVKKGIRDFDVRNRQGTDPSDAEANKILGQMNGIVDLTEQQLSLLVQHKARFEKLHVGGLVKKNMAKSDEASTELEKIMRQKSPAELKPEAEQLAKRRAAAFAKSKLEFAQSTGGEDQADGDDDSD